MRTLYTNGVTINKTIAQYESYGAIRYSLTDQITPAILFVSDAGSLDLRLQLGTQNSTIYAGAGSMQIMTGDGDDFIVASTMDDTIYGGDGNNGYIIGLGDDIVYGGSGKDVVNFGLQKGEHDTFYGGAGDDEILLTQSLLRKASLYAGTGIDRITFLPDSAGSQTLKIRPAWSIEEVSGSIRGTVSDDVLDLSGVVVIGGFTVDCANGNDLITVSHGASSLYGGYGDDTLVAGDLGSYLIGGPGSDVIYGTVGDDTFSISFSDLEEDSLYGGGGTDAVVISGGSASNFTYADLLAWTASITIYDNRVSGTVGNDTINFGGFQITTGIPLPLLLPFQMDGYDGNDLLVGSSNRDFIDGGTGRDTMDGRGGDDAYRVDSRNDLVLESSGGGYDVVACNLRTYTLPDFVERVEFFATGAITAFGNSEDNIFDFYGNSGAEVRGYGGNDELGPSLLSFGGSGNDGLSAVAASSTLYGGGGADFLTGSQGDDILYGGAGNDQVNGQNGNDSLYGTGGDTMDGGEGGDTYFATTGDVVLDSGSFLSAHDAVYGKFSQWTLAVGIESYFSRAQTGAYIVGNSLSNSISGSSFDDTLEGSAGDSLTGGRGDDTYILDGSANIAITESIGGGIDRVVTTGVYYTLASEVEQLDFTAGIGGISNVRGNELDNLILAHAGKDTIDGGLGADTMDGGEDDDTYIIDNTADLVLDTGTTTNDEAQVFSRSWKLTKGVETAIVEGDLDTTLIGNVLDNLLIGFNGIDTLQGGAGNDILIGWAGHDLLTGNSGSDIFAFDIAPLDLHSDIVTDFAHGLDAIFLASTNSRPFSILPTGQLAAADFRVMGDGPLDASDRVLYDSATGTLYFDQDGSGAAVAVKFAVLSNLATVDAADIWVY